MDTLFSRYYFFLLLCFITIGVQSQEKVTKEKKKSTHTSIISDQHQNSEIISNMPIYNLFYDEDKEMNVAFNDIISEEQISMPIYDPISSLLINPNKQLTMGEIAKKLEGNY